MLIRQEDTGDVEDFYYDKVHKALRLIESSSTDTICDTMLVKEACKATITILKSFISHVEKVETKNEQKSVQQAVMDKLQYGID